MPPKALVVTASAVVMVLGTLIGFGLLGTPVDRSSSGAFAADATLMTPATQAFSVWSLIYVGLLGYVIWQWRERQSERLARIAWLAALSMLLNALWLAVTQTGQVWLSVVVILALALVLGVLVKRLQESRPQSLVETVVVDGTFGVYLGWVSVASVANVTTALQEWGVDPGPDVSQVLAVAVIAVAAALGVLFAFTLGARWAVAAAMAWALGWIAVGRFAGPLFSTATAVAAVLAALVILAVTAVLNASGRSPRRAAPAAGASHG